MSVCPICENAHGDECSPSALRARIEREAETVTKLTGDVATLEETAGLLGADREALWKVVRDACAVLRVTDDDEKDWPKLTGAVADLAARLAEAEATLANERGEGEPPEPGWQCVSSTIWNIGCGGQPGYASVSRGTERGCPWHWYAGGFEGVETTARAAMRAASERLRGSS